MGMELFALKQIAQSLKERLPQHSLHVNPYFRACERQPDCLKFLLNNHQPTHPTGDVLDRRATGSKDTTKALTLEKRPQDGRPSKGASMLAAQPLTSARWSERMPT